MQIKKLKNRTHSTESTLTQAAAYPSQGIWNVLIQAAAHHKRESVLIGLLQ